VRDGLRAAPGRTAASPLWTAQVDWTQVLHEIGLGHPLKFIWEERAESLTSYPNFWKQLYRKHPELRQATVTARDFTPGERVEVDYAGDPIEWVDLRTGEVRKAWVFVAGLGFSQLLFAWAADDMKSRNWLDCHQRMCAFYSGVPHVTVPDCLKQGVLKCRWYDPDLNPSYAALAAHYATEVVPARPSPRIYIRDSTLAIDGSRLDRGDDPGGTLAMQGRLVGSYRSIVRQAERSSAERDCRLFIDRG
jgi:uncharacterized protein YodC (DUF2158 family)